LTNLLGRQANTFPILHDLKHIAGQGLDGAINTLDNLRLLPEHRIAISAESVFHGKILDCYILL